MKEFLIGAAGIVLAGAAFAQTQPAPVPAAPQVSPVPSVAPMADRVHTRDEVVAKVREHFAMLDANSDGYLTKEESEAGSKVFKERIRGKMVERHAKRMEHHDPAQAFDRLDTNKDGVISRAEFNAAHERRVERRVIRHAPGAAAAPGAAHEGMRMHRMGKMMMGGHMFAMADANKDGRVSLKEATDAAVRHFDMADANRDGRVTPDERRQMHRQMMEKHRAPKVG